MLTQKGRIYTCSLSSFAIPPFSPCKPGGVHIYACYTIKVELPFEIVGEIGNVETIAAGGRIRDVMRLRKQFGFGRWRKLKGHATVRLANGRIRMAELHWYEAHGIGKKKMKIKRFLD